MVKIVLDVDVDVEIAWLKFLPKKMSVKFSILSWKILFLFDGRGEEKRREEEVRQVWFLMPKSEA